MFKTKFINLKRRDLLKQLVALGALSTTGGSISGFAQSRSGIDMAHRGEDIYDTLRSTSLWRSNLPDRHPDVIVEASSVDDLRAALAFARENDLQVVCRASGHATSGAPLRNGGMMIYVSQMNNVSIDEDSRTATVGPGVTMARLLGMASQYGLDFPTADCSSVALAGFILGGGFGRNCMQLTKGPVCNALISAEVMLASGELVTVSEDNNPELFWAMRGCGPAFFGIVTKMTLPLFDPPGAYMASTYQFSLAALPSLVKFFDQHSANQDPRVSIRISLRPLPDSPADSMALVRVNTFSEPGPQANAEARQRLAYYSTAGLGDGAYEKNEFNDEDIGLYMMTTDPTAGTHTDNVFTDDASSLLAASHLMQTRPEGFSIHLDLGYKMQYYQSSGDDISYSAAGSHFLSIYVDWTDTSPERNELAYEWADRFANIAKQYGDGNYLNQVDTALYPEKISQSFSAESWEKLGDVRQQYDPDSRFFSYVGM